MPKHYLEGEYYKGKGIYTPEGKFKQPQEGESYPGLGKYMPDGTFSKKPKEEPKKKPGFFRGIKDSFNEIKKKVNFRKSSDGYMKK